MGEGKHNPGKEGLVVKYEYLNCANNEEVVLLKVIGGGHTWPGAFGPDTNQDIIADQEIWRFFLKHQLPTTSGTVEQDISFEWVVFPNPASDFLHVSLSEDQRMEEIMVVDLFGKVVQLQRFETRDINTPVTIDLNGLPSGSYFLMARMEGQRTAIKRFVVMR